MGTKDSDMFHEKDEEDNFDDPIRLWDLDEETVFCGSKNYFRNSDMFHEEDEEDYLDDPIRLWDLEEETVFCGSKNYFRNVTIEDPGYRVNILFDDYEVRQRSVKGPAKVGSLKELKKRKSYVCTNNNANLLKKYQACSVKMVDCYKFPWYYRNKIGSTNKAQSPNTKHTVIELETEQDTKEIVIIDLTGNQNVEYNKIYEDRIPNVNKQMEIFEANSNELTDIINSDGGRAINQTEKMVHKPVLNIQNEKPIKVPTSEVEKDSDLIRTNTRIEDQAIKKFKSKKQSCPNYKKLSHDVSNKLILGSKSFIKMAKDKNSNDCRKFNKIKDIYTSEQISNTKIKIRKGSVKPKEIISIKAYYEQFEGKACYTTLTATNIENHNSSKRLEKNTKQLDHYKNKPKNIEPSLLPIQASCKSNIETKKSPSLGNRQNDCERTNGCNKQLFSAHRIIPHFHENSSFNRRNNLSKIHSNINCPKRSNETNYETLNIKNSSGSNETPNNIFICPRERQAIQDYNNNNNINDVSKKYNNIKADNSKMSTDRYVNTSPVTYKIPVNNKMMLKNTPASPDVIMEQLNNIDTNINYNKIASQLEEERPRYLLPSNCDLTDSYIQNIFTLDGGNNLNNPPLLKKKQT